MELLAQVLHGMMKEGADIADGETGGGGNVAIAEAGLELEPHQFPLPVRKRLDQPLETVRIVLFLQGHRRTRRGVIDGLVECECSVHGDDALLFSLMIDDDTAADGEEPRGEAFQLAGGPVPEIPEKSVLHRVTRGFGISRMVPRESKERALVAIEQGLCGKVQVKEGTGEESLGPRAERCSSTGITAPAGFSWKKAEKSRLSPVAASCNAGVPPRLWKYQLASMGQTYRR